MRAREEDEITRKFNKQKTSIYRPPRKETRSLFMCISMLILGALVGCKNNEPEEPTFTSPDSKVQYTCGQAHGPERCRTHWCWNQTSEDLIGLRKMEGIEWRPCYVGWTGVNNGGVSWWRWERGSIGDKVLHNFYVRDYRELRGAGDNDTFYGDAQQIKPAKKKMLEVIEIWNGIPKTVRFPDPETDDFMRFCYQVKWKSKLWGTYCMVPMASR
jgi:hypothetical protein